jgi:hypothetical protein
MIVTGTFEAGTQQQLEIGFVIDRQNLGRNHNRELLTAAKALAKHFGNVGFVVDNENA